jgi:hypothetical protein
VIPFPRTPEELLLEKEAEQVAVQALSHLSEKEQECLALLSLLQRKRKPTTRSTKRQR